MLQSSVSNSLLIDHRNCSPPSWSGRVCARYAPQLGYLDFLVSLLYKQDEYASDNDIRVPILVFEATAFSLAVGKTVAHLRSTTLLKGSFGAVLMKTILRDSIVYFGVILCLYIINATLWRYARVRPRPATIYFIGSHFVPASTPRSSPWLRPRPDLFASLPYANQPAGEDASHDSDYLIGEYDPAQHLVSENGFCSNDYAGWNDPWHLECKP
jgi:hypothetical protein